MSAYYNDNDPFVCQWLENLIAAGLLPTGRVDCRPIEEVAKADVEGFTQCHFFAGIGGWAYALQLAGWGDRPVWTGSCPCQPFSAAGKGKAEDDPRHLWPSWFRLIRECRPVRVFGEQVANAAGHGWIDLVSTDMEAEAYTVGAVVLGAHSVAAPQIRHRFYFVGESDRARRTIGARVARDDGAAHGQATGETAIETGAIRRVDDTASARCNGAWQGTEGEARHEARVRGPQRGCAASGLAEPESPGGRADVGAVRGGADARLRAPEGKDERGSILKAGGTVDRRPTRSVADAQRGPTERRGHDVAIAPSAPESEALEWEWLRTHPWAGCEFIPCTDGKWRAVPPEPTLFPLAARLSGRVGILRGSGNSVNPYTAAAFVSAYLEGCA